MTRVFLAGSGMFGLNVASALEQAGHVVVGTVSPAHGRTSSQDLLRGWAERNDRPWSDVITLTPGMVPDGTDVIMTAHSHAFIGTRTRARAPLAIGYHPSLLPLHRGRDAVKWQARLHERVTGGTVYHLTNRIDGGPIAAQRMVIVPDGIDHRTLWRTHLHPLGVSLLVEVAALVENHGTSAVASIPQDDTLATWEPSMTTEPLYRPELLELGPARPAPAPTHRHHTTPTRGTAEAGVPLI